MSYKVGQPVRSKLTLKVDEVLTDATVTFMLKSPTGAVTSRAATRDGVGLYSCVWSAAEINEHGTWRVRAVSSGAADGATESAFKVDHSEFA